MRRIKAEFKPVPNFSRYRCDPFGNIESYVRGGKPKRLKGAYKKSTGVCEVGLLRDDGKRVFMTVAKVVYITHIGEVKDGNVVCHKNGDPMDNVFSNLEQTTRKKLCGRNGGITKRRPVVKKDRYGNVVEFYPSATEAGRRNNYDPRTIKGHCDGEFKPMDGYIYEWDK